MLDPALARVALVPAALLAAGTALVLSVGDLPGERSLLARAQAEHRVVVGAAETVDAMTGYAPVLALTAAAAVALLVTGRPGGAARIALAVGGALVGASLLKRLVERPRPDLLSPVADVSQWSFPSGHAAATAALALAAALALHGRPAPQRAAAAAGAAVVLVAAAAQLALARHHPSDLLGGWLWAAAWVTAVESVRPGRSGSRAERAPG